MLGLSSSQRKLLHCVKLMQDSGLPFLLVSPNTLQRRCTTERGAWKGGVKGGGRGEGRGGGEGKGGGGGGERGRAGGGGEVGRLRDSFSENVPGI